MHNLIGYKHTCALSMNGILKCFGENEDGQLGYEDAIHRGDSVDEMGDSLESVSLGSHFDVTKIPELSMGASHSCAANQHGRYFSYSVTARNVINICCLIRIRKMEVLGFWKVLSLYIEITSFEW